MGRFRTAISLFAVILSYCTICVVSLEPAICKGKDIKVSEEDQNAIKDCVKEITGGDLLKDVAKDKTPCVGKCILMKRGMINENGMAMKDEFIKSVKASMPAEVLPDLTSALEHCVDDFGKVDTNPNDETCASYHPFWECIIKSFLTACVDDSNQKKTA